MPHPTKMGSASLLDALTAVVGQASAAILALAPDALNLRRKADGSPVTAADEAAEALILDALMRLLPGVPVVSEEAATRPSVLGPTFLLVDPLDGTREFITGRPEFTVNIALVQDGAPQLGILAAPALHRLWRGIVGQGAERLSLSADACAPNAPEAISARQAPSRLVVMTSRSHLDAGTEALLARLPVSERQGIGSSVKFGYVAEGSADLYVRLAPTSEWDIAAGHAVLAAAGGSVTTPDGKPIQYGGAASDFKVPAFIAWGDRDAARRLRA